MNNEKQVLLPYKEHEELLEIKRKWEAKLENLPEYKITIYHRQDKRSPDVYRYYSLNFENPTNTLTEVFTHEVTNLIEHNKELVESIQKKLETLERTFTNNDKVLTEMVTLMGQKPTLTKRLKYLFTGKL